MTELHLLTLGMTCVPCGAALRPQTGGFTEIHATRCVLPASTRHRCPFSKHRIQKWVSLLKCRSWLLHLYSSDRLTTPHFHQHGHRVPQSGLSLCATRS